MSEPNEFDWNRFFFVFFFICFVGVMTVGAFAIFTYNANAPEKPASGAHGGMLLPQDGQYAPHVVLRPVA